MDGQEAPPAPELLLHLDKGQVTMLQCWQPPSTSLEQHLELLALILLPWHRHWEGNVWPTPLHLGLLQLPLPTEGIRLYPNPAAVMDGRAGWEDVAAAMESNRGRVS